MCCSFVSSFAGWQRRKEKQEAYLNVVGDYFNDYKEEKIVNEKYPEVLQRLKNNLKTFK